MRSTNAEVIYFFRTQALRLLYYVLPVLVPAALWDGWLLAQGAMRSSMQTRVILPSLIVSLLFTGLAVGAIDALARGQTPQLGILWKKALHRGPYLFAVQTLMLLGAFLAALPLILPGLYVAGRLVGAQVDAPLSQAGVGQMLRASWQRSRGHAWALITGYLSWMIPAVLVGWATQWLIRHHVPAAQTTLAWMMYSASYMLTLWLNLLPWIFLYRRCSELEPSPG